MLYTLNILHLQYFNYTKTFHVQFLNPLICGVYIWLDREQGGSFRYCGSPKDSLSSSKTNPFIWSNAVMEFSFMKLSSVKPI